MLRRISRQAGGDFARRTPRIAPCGRRRPRGRDREPGLATAIDFESAASESAAATLGTPSASLSGGLVLSEIFVSALLGHPSAGTWNTTPAARLAR